MNRRKINLHIETLVFTGIARTQHQDMKTAMIDELTRLISQGRFPAVLNRSQRIPQVDGGKVEISRHTSPKALGARLAGQIYKGVVR
jgi:hypothetical protein